MLGLGQRDLTLEDIISILRRRWPLIAVLAVLGAALGYGVTYVIPKQYTSKTVVLVQPPTVPTDYVKPVVSNDINQRLAAMQQQILSRSQLEPIIRQLDLYSADINKVPMEALVNRLRKAITVSPIRPMAETQSGLPGFDVSVEYTDPNLAQQICSTITSMFMEQNLKLRQQITDQTTDFISRQLDAAKKQLDAKDAELAAFQRRYLGSLPDQEQTNLNLLMSLNAQLEATTQSLNRAQQNKAFAQSTLNQQLAAWQESKDGKNPETYEQQLIDLETQLTALQARYTDSYPDVIKVKNDIAALKKKVATTKDPVKTAETDSGLTSLEPPQIQALRAQIHQYNQTIKAATAQQEDLQHKIKIYEARVQSTPAVEEQYKKLTRNYKTALDFYNGLLTKRDDATMATDLERRQQGQQFQVLDQANLPDAPSFPNQMYFGLGGLGGGLALGCGLTLLFELQDTSFRTERDVESFLQLPVLAMVPALRSLGGKHSRETSIRLVVRS